MTTVQRSTAVLADLKMNEFGDLIAPVLFKTGHTVLLKACFMLAPWSDSGFLDIFMSNLKSITIDDDWLSAVELLIPSLYYLYLEQSNDPYSGKEDPRNNQRFHRKFWKAVGVKNSRGLMEQPFFKQFFPDHEASDIENPPPKKETPAKHPTRVDLVEQYLKEGMIGQTSEKLRQQNITAQLICDSTIEDLRFTLQGDLFTVGEKLALLSIHHKYV